MHKNKKSNTANLYKILKIQKTFDIHRKTRYN